MSTVQLRRSFLESLSEDEIEQLRLDWPLWARANQCPPLMEWRTWFLLGGRGSGKTRTGAEWLKGVALGDPHFPGSAAGRVALVGENYDNVRDVMVEGESGLLSIHRKTERPAWISSRRELIWPNGTIGKLFSASDPEGLRGSQFGASWCDEVCKWKYLEETWDMLQFCLRLGSSPRQVVTTTPKPLPLLKRLLKEPSAIAVRSSTNENAGNLAGGFLQYMRETYSGTSLGRQELDGEIIEYNQHALWKQSAFNETRADEAPALSRIVVAVDPPAGSGKRAASCGIIAAGIDAGGTCYILEDRTIAGAAPEKWAATAVALYHDLEADLIVAEVNQGGDMVKTIIHTVDNTVPVRAVHASRGKWIRAEPVALLYERGRVRHVGKFAELEDQMCAIGPDGTAEGVSPDRVDALVWAITELALVRRAEPRVRRA